MKWNLKKMIDECAIIVCQWKGNVIPGMFDTPVYFETYILTYGIPTSLKTDARPPSSGRPDVLSADCPPSTARRQLFRKNASAFLGFAKR